MARRKQIDYQCPPGRHSQENYEFAYELGAEIMKENMNRKDNYLKKLNEQNDNQSRLENAKEFDLNQQKQNQEKNRRNDRMENGQEFQYSNQQNRENRQNQNRSLTNRVEFSNNETMRPMRNEYYASREYEPMDEHEDFLIEKQNQKNDKNFRKR